MDDWWVAFLGCCAMWLASLGLLRMYLGGGPRNFEAMGSYGMGLQAAPFFFAAFSLILVAFLFALLPPVAACADGGLVHCGSALAPVALLLFGAAIVATFAALKEAMFPSRRRRLPGWWCDVWDPSRPKRYRR